MGTAAEPGSDRARLEELAYVGPATAEVLAAADVSPEDVRQKSVTYRDLVEAGVHPGVAGKIRREHSLHWSHDHGGVDLDRRSDLVRGLSDGEREWVAGARSDGAADGDEGDETDEPAFDGAGDWPD